MSAGHVTSSESAPNIAAPLRSPGVYSLSGTGRTKTRRPRRKRRIKEAPSGRADGAVNDDASARRLEQRARAADVATIWMVLIPRRSLVPFGRLRSRYKSAGRCRGAASRRGNGLDRRPSRNQSGCSQGFLPPVVGPNRFPTSCSRSPRLRNSKPPHEQPQGTSPRFDIWPQWPNAARTIAYHFVGDRLLAKCSIGL
jgi:hypothetical protein